MSSGHFTHLHVHTDHSLLDGAISVSKLIDFARSTGARAIGISDHGNVFGGVKFFQSAAKAGIKPILGCELYLTEDIRIKRADNKYYHLLVVVENDRGYQNLCRLMHIAHTRGFYFKPRIDYQALKDHNEGLIVTSACLGGHIPQLLLQHDEIAAQDRLDWFLKVFNQERFFLEVQPADQHEQKIINEQLYHIAASRGIPLVATGDCHYVSPEDREAHEVMLAIQTHHKMSDPGRFTFGDCRVHLRSQDEMLSIFSHHQEAVFNTGLIADRCTFSYEMGRLFFPQFELPAAYTPEDYFKESCKRGLDALFDQDRIERSAYARYQERLILEMDLIISMGFVGYFLVVSDFIQWAKRQDIPVGPGRGSAAGSLVAWALQITDIDPIKYNLLFERFLNPERVTMPDIDIDFCIYGRELVINYVKERYGHDKVCQIITFGTMQAKGVIKDAARALDIPFEDANALTDLIPDQLKITLQQSLEQEPRLKELYETNPRIAKLFSIAFKLEGLTRHASKHAAGIVISPEPIQDVLPVYIPPKTNDLVTQYAMTELEALGFLKMDFLGLKNLTLIQETCRAVAENHGIEIDIIKIPLEDEKTFALLCAGKTSGVFQLESDGLKDTLRRLQPEKFEDIIAVNALYRPGPLGSGMVDDFIERRHGRQKITYVFDELEPILQETYGVIVYQEQVMKISSTIGGYSLGEADILRRAMGKKKADVMAEQKEIFVQRAVIRGFDKKRSQELFDLMAYFAGYGFNKSHSAAYALIAYQTAYLKAHYTAEFMAALISLEAGDPEKMAFYLAEARSCDIAILGPDCNQSRKQFRAHLLDQGSSAIRFGLAGIKNVGDAALEALLSERDKAHFVSMEDLCMRVDMRIVNKRVLESLIYAGAFDSLPGSRAQKINDIGIIHERTAAIRQQNATGQMGLFAQASNGLEDTYQHEYRACEEFDQKTSLEKEKEYLGIYLSAQPLDPYKKQARLLGCDSLSFLLQHRPSRVITCLATVSSVREIVTKKGDRMAFVALDDGVTQAELVLFPKVYARAQDIIQQSGVIACMGVIDQTRLATVTIKAQDVMSIDEICTSQRYKQIWIDVPAILLQDDAFLSALKERLHPGKISCSLRTYYEEQCYSVNFKQSYTLSNDLIDFIEQHGAKIVAQW